jgi:hypothetical protein
MDQPMLFAIPASNALVQKTREIVHRDPAASLEAMRSTVIRAGMLYVDSVVDGFVVSFMRDGLANQLTQALLRNLASLIKAVTRATIREAARQAGERELEAITRFFQERIVTTVKDGQKLGLIIYPLEEPQHERLARAIRAGSVERPQEQRDVYVVALRSMLDESLSRHYDDAFAKLELGVVAKGAVRLGRRAIHGAGHTAVRLSMARESEQELRALSRVLKEHLVPATMCRPA